MLEIIKELLSSFYGWCKGKQNGKIVTLSGLLRRRKCEKLLFENNSIEKIKELNWLR